MLVHLAQTVAIQGVQCMVLDLLRRIWGRGSGPAETGVPETEPPKEPTTTPEPPPQPRERHKGVVKFFKDNSWGFIRREGKPDIFFHVSQIEGDWRPSPNGGEKVSFEIGPGHEGDQAEKIRLVEEPTAAPELPAQPRRPDTRVAGGGRRAPAAAPAAPRDPAPVRSVPPPPPEPAAEPPEVEPAVELKRTGGVIKKWNPKTGRGEATADDGKLAKFGRTHLVEGVDESKLKPGARVNFVPRPRGKEYNARDVALGG